VTTDVIYTAGPLRVELLAIQNGQVVLSTSRNVPPPSRPMPSHSLPSGPITPTPTPTPDSVTPADAGTAPGNVTPDSKDASDATPPDVEESPFFSPDDL
ncbi:MAG TPA: hypothetical protein V6D04_13610, partial [Candidatus Obscuribacterales bacterium]